MKKQSVLVSAVGLAVTMGLGGCSTGGQGTSGLNLVTPAYLSVTQFKDCLASQEEGSYSRWCLPAERPGSCPLESWEQLQQMTGADRVPDCD